MGIIYKYIRILAYFTIYAQTAYPYTPYAHRAYPYTLYADLNDLKKGCKNL